MPTIRAALLIAGAALVLGAGPAAAQSPAPAGAASLAPVAGALPADLPASWSLPSVAGLRVGPAIAPLPASPRQARYGLPGPDRLTVTAAAGGELHGLEGSDTVVGAAGADRLFGETGADALQGGPATTCSTAARATTA